VRAQTFSDWEIVAVDDGSSDGTWELLSKAGPRVLALRRESAGGPAAARNLALAHAGGELVAFLDADDLLLPRYLERQLACYRAAASGAGAPVGLVGCDARILCGDRYAPYTHAQRVRGGRRALTLERLLRFNPLHVSCLVPTAVGERVGWFDRELFGTEDYGLWIKILERGYRAVLSEEVLAVYRRVPGALSSNLARQARNNRRAYEQALARGHLTGRQRRIARRSIRYNRAMEQVALRRFGAAEGEAGSATGVARSAAGRADTAARAGRPGALGLGDRRAGGAGVWWLRHAPALLEAALCNPRRWPGWLRLLHSGRAEDAAELRASP
jgi:glycosyltransferase involved in cell wall biosynthesis